jgi:adenine-specific DNA-methyltransferase
MTKEQKFFNALKDIFIGAKVEGESGYINLMRIKSRYYEKGVFPKLHEDIEKALKPFPHFREELFDKLYSFFNRYFSESGSIYFRYTPLHQNIYEKVYTDDKDVMLFYKTHMLYYVKTDRLFKNLEVEIDGQKFFFDVSTLEHKKANEKREIIYYLKDKQKNGTIVFSVSYSEKGKKTKVDDIFKTLKKQGVKLTEELLERAFRVFERQSEVDYFINKNAGAFLEEQFNLWLYQYVFSGESEWTETRIKQLQTLKDIALKIIAFISQFEDELVKIWNKPKFVLNSNYVITLDRLMIPSPLRGEGNSFVSPPLRGGDGGAGEDLDLIEKLLKHPNFKSQIEEWQQLGIVSESFKKSDILKKDLAGTHISKEYRYLPIDTKYFKALELEILGLFENLDEELDGWLIKSENYQALNTNLQKFCDRVQLIYIDPPFNKGEDADYYYAVNYKDAAWITLLENRLKLAKQFLSSNGSIFLRCNYDGNMFVRLLMNEIFGTDNFRNEVIVRRAEESKGEFVKQFTSMKSMTVNYDNIYWYSRNSEARFNKINKPISEEDGKAHWHSFWKAEDRPNLRYELLGIDLSKHDRGQWMWKKSRALTAVENYEQYLKETEKKEESLDKYWVRTGQKLEFIKREGKGIASIKYWIPTRESVIADNNWLDIKGYANIWGFKTENSEVLLNRIIDGISFEGKIILDFFPGSGTTIAVAHKLQRKWLGIEVGHHFETIIIPRMKEILAGTGNHEPCGISKDVKWKGGGFFKYYEMEQYEDTLRRVKYDDADLFDDPNKDPYTQYVFLRALKMLEALDVDLKENKVTVDLSKLYDGIDIAETLSNLTGKWIKKITKDRVEFADGEAVDLKNLDYKLIKPLIWW